MGIQWDHIASTWLDALEVSANGLHSALTQALQRLSAASFMDGRLRKRSRLVGITHREVWFGYESKPWYPSEPQITGKRMFIPPNIARLVLIHPHMIWVGGHLIGPQMADMFMNHNVVSRNRDMSTIWDPKLSNHGVLSVSNGIAEMLKVKCHHLQTYLQYCHTAYALLDTYIYIYITSSIVFWGCNLNLGTWC